MGRSLLATRPGDTLVVVDVQNDFLAGGALAVPGANELVPGLNRYLGLWRKRGLPSFASRDWHPPDHVSFRQRGGPWPRHCIADSEGARFSRWLELPPETPVLSKGTERDRDAYSVF